MQARMALQLPWWTLAGGFGAMAALAQLGDSVPEVQAALERRGANRDWSKQKVRTSERQARRLPAPGKKSLWVHCPLPQALS